LNLALFDVDTLAQAVVSALRDRDAAALAGYSDTVLPHLWRYQEFSATLATEVR
jgi:p-hydroxybenzoate 3-monooxygenase